MWGTCTSEGGLPLQIFAPKVAEGFELEKNDAPEGVGPGNTLPLTWLLKRDSVE